MFEAIPREKVRHQFDVNVFGVMDVTRAILPHFRKNKGGVIVNISPVRDGTDRLRYLVGDDACRFIKALSEMSDQDYVNFMRSQFAY